MPTFLTDFGLAKAAATGSRFTRTGEALGTPAYMSPEQARGETADLTPATDVWSLGCVLYELLAGRPPFGGDGAAEVIGAVLTSEPAPLARLRPDVPRDVATVVRVALAKPAHRRHASAGHLRDELDRLLRGERPRQRPRRPRMAIAAVAVAGLAAVAVALAWATGPAPGPTVAPDLAEVLAARAESLLRDDPAEAGRLLERALAATPGRHDWRVRLGLVCWTTGDTPGAQAAWAAVPYAAPESTRARWYAALHRMAQAMLAGQHAAGVVAHAEAVALRTSGGDVGRLAEGLSHLGTPGAVAARATLADITGWDAALVRAYLAGTDDPESAQREWATVLAEGPSIGFALHNRALALSGMGDDFGALRAYDAALEQDPTLHLIRMNRGALRAALGDPVGGREDYDAVLALLPGDAATLVNRGQLRGLQGDAAGARADYDAAIVANPSSALAYLNRGVLNGREGNRAAALADYTAAIRCEPGSVEALINRGIARRLDGDPDGARADFDAAIAAHPEAPNAWLSRGILREDAGDMAGAITDFDATLALEPDHGEAYMHRGFVRTNIGDLAGARADLESALRSDAPAPVRRAARFGLRRSGRVSAGLSAPGARAEAYRGLGWVHAKLGEHAAAVAAYQESLRLFPNSPKAGQIRAALAKAEAALRDSGGR